LGPPAEIRGPLALYRSDRGDEAWARIDVFQGRYLAELAVVRLHNADGPTSAAMFGTARPAGFDVAHRAALERIAPALRNACELRTLRQGELNLLDTYFGATTAQRILAGRIRRGQVESLDAALMLCDLRGFTDLSNRLPTERVLELLNLYFDQVLPAIAEGGGEVLKFMGDAVMAFFRRVSGARSPRPSRRTGRQAAGRRRAALWQGELRQHRLRPPPRLHGDRPGRQSGEPHPDGLRQHRPAGADVAALYRPDRTGAGDGDRLP
jgi:adenylate cyclase